MPDINLDSATATNPDQIPAAGETVTFTVRARCPTGAQQARFTFKLRPDDGYRWSSGGTSVERVAGITDDWTEIPFDLTLQQVNATGAKLLLIDVEGVLVSGSAAKKSLARLTVENTLEGMLVAHREANGLARPALAEDLSISTSWLGKLENGASPSPELLKTMKKVLEA